MIYCATNKIYYPTYRKHKQNKLHNGVTYANHITVPEYHSLFTPHASTDVQVIGKNHYSLLSIHHSFCPVAENMTCHPLFGARGFYWLKKHRVNIISDSVSNTSRWRCGIERISRLLPKQFKDSLPDILLLREHPHFPPLSSLKFSPPFGNGETNRSNGGW